MASVSATYRSEPTSAMPKGESRWSMKTVFVSATPSPSASRSRTMRFAFGAPAPAFFCTDL